MRTLVEEYQELLVAEESLSGLTRAIELVEKVLDEPEPGVVHRPSLTDLPEGVGFPQLQEVAKRRRRARQGIERQALVVKTAYLLSVAPALVEAADPELPLPRYALYMDSSLVLFHQAYFALLPHLHGQSWQQERSAMITSFRRFSEHLPRSSDRYNVLALYYEAREDYERAAHYYRESLGATHSDDHEFMTVLQTCWSFLLEHQMLQQAFDVLLDAYPRVARQDLDEMRELMASTFQFQRRFYEDRGRTGSLARGGLRPRTSEA